MESKAELILVQVSRMYRRYGIKSVTMDDVAKHLGISKKTLYSFFRDKEDLVHKVLMLEHKRQYECYDALEARGLNAVEEYFEVYKILKGQFNDYHPSMEYDLRKYYPDLYFRIRSIRRKRLLESTTRNLNRGKKEGLYRKDLNTKLIAKLHLSRIESMFDSDLFTTDELTSFKVVREVFLYHLYGIMSPAGRDFFEENLKKFREFPS